jgi:hypothetical protein
MPAAVVEDRVAAASLLDEAARAIGRQRAGVESPDAKFNAMQAEFAKPVPDHCLCRVAPIAAPRERRVERYCEQGRTVLDSQMVERHRPNQCSGAVSAGIVSTAKARPSDELPLVARVRQ